MTLNKYQKLAWKTALYPNKKNNLYYPSLGLAGKSGEVCNIIKRAMRDDNGFLTKEKREKLKKEIGDVLWYVAALCKELDLEMEKVAEVNINKLLSRKKEKK